MLIPDVADLVYEDVRHGHQGRDILIPVTFPLWYLNILLVVRTQIPCVAAEVDAGRQGRQ